MKAADNSGINRTDKGGKGKDIDPVPATTTFPWRPATTSSPVFCVEKLHSRVFFRKTDCRSAADQQNAQHERLWCTQIRTLCSQFRQPHGNLRVASRRFTPHPGRLSACLLTSSSGMLSTARLRSGQRRELKAQEKVRSPAANHRLISAVG